MRLNAEKALKLLPALQRAADALSRIDPGADQQPQNHQRA
jgi:hypothetical protein